MLWIWVSAERWSNPREALHVPGLSQHPKFHPQGIWETRQKWPLGQRRNRWHSSNAWQTRNVRQVMGTLSWKTVRAAMVTTLTEQKISSFSTNVDAEELPLTVYQARGWSDEIIKRFPSFHSNEYGCEVYGCTVRRLNWKEEFANIENRILQKEQDFARRRGRERGKLDVPQEKESPAEAGRKALHGKRRRHRRSSRARTSAWQI